MQRKVMGVAVTLALISAATTACNSARGDVAGEHARTRAAAPTTMARVAADAPRDPDVPRWQFVPEDEPGAMTADAQGTVLLGGDRAVIALDHGGTVSWQVPLAGLGIEYPALGDGLVIVSTATGTGPDAGGAFVALDRSTGRRRWRMVVRGMPGPVTVAREHIFAATQEGQVFALSPTGHVQWRVDVGGVVASRGNLAYDPVSNTIATVGFVAHQGWMLFLIDATDGHDAGGLDLGATDPPSAAVAAGPRRFVVGDGDSHELLVIDLATRRVARAIRTPGAYDPSSVPAVDGDLAVVIDRDGTVTAADLGTGSVHWQAALDQPVLDARPLLGPGAVVVAPFASPLVAFARADGRAIPVPASRAPGVPVAEVLDGATLVVATRLADPGRVTGWPVP